jgi:hypothetical protein
VTSPESRPAEIEAHIERTRQELGDTVDALSAKLDVKSRVLEQVGETKERVAGEFHAARQRLGEAAARGQDALTTERGDVKRLVPVAGAVAVVVVVAVTLILRRRPR